jgi:ppGpp synthetase/RelA/SpoT-type nucleotidyltranferase
MSGNEVEEARKRWIAERPLYENFGVVLETRLKSAIRKIGIPVEVTSRAKEADSFVKKLLLKTDHTYESLPDKVGVRVVHKFRSDSPRILAVISESLEHGLPDDKAKDRGRTNVGYLTIHIDHARLRNGDQGFTEFPPEAFFAEIQLRTLAQHLWSEMSHDDVYKNDDTVNTLPDDLVRRVHLMAGQVEVADREFDRINSELERDDTSKLLKALERNYYKLTSRRGNPELSLSVINLLIPTFRNSSVGEIITHIDGTFEAHQRTLEVVYQDSDRASDPSAFFYQPEAIMIYDRLLDDPTETLRVWSTQFPFSELERVANNLGLTLD